MTSKAHAKFNPDMFGVSIAVIRDHGARRELLRWQPVEVAVIDPETATEDPSGWLRLQEEDARAIYEALADYFGHAGHDIRALRKDYDAERVRVDRLIGAIIDQGGRP